MPLRYGLRMRVEERIAELMREPLSELRSQNVLHFFCALMNFVFRPAELRKVNLPEAVEADDPGGSSLAVGSKSQHLGI